VCVCVFVSEGVSGERIWLEVKKIALGRYADSMFSVMAELGVTSHIGWRVQIYAFCSGSTCLN